MAFTAFNASSISSCLRLSYVDHSAPRRLQVQVVLPTRLDSTGSPSTDVRPSFCCSPSVLIPAISNSGDVAALLPGRRGLFMHALAVVGGMLALGSPSACADDRLPQFHELDGSGGVTALDFREGTGETPRDGDKVVIHYFARLTAKQGWRFDSSYEHRDETGTPVPYVFVIGDGTVIAGLDSAVRSMKEGGVRRVVIPPSQGYQDRVQGPVPPKFSDRQRLYTTIFNPTRIANGEGSTLGILVFDIVLLKIRRA